MKQQSINYFRDREREEREAASKATCDQARWAHQEMAESYARLLKASDPKLD